MRFVAAASEDIPSAHPGDVPERLEEVGCVAVGVLDPDVEVLELERQQIERDKASGAHLQPEVDDLARRR
ncbi:MAG: hypothetical protein U0838_12995 [Chloroflexota bacterium]